MKREVISTEKAPGAIGPYSQGVRAGEWLYISGQIPIDPATGEVIRGDIAAQTERVLRNAAAILEAAGASLSDVVKVTIYVADLKDFSSINEVYGQYFTSNPPARVCVEVSGLPRGAGLEVEMVAYLGK